MPDGQHQKVCELRLEKPIEVLFEGSDEDIYKPIENVSLDLVDDIKEDFCFLHVGMWGVGGLGDDRKDIGTMIKTFYESFANKKKQPALLLKSSGATSSIVDREECLRKINEIKDKFPKDWDLPNVYLLHGDLSDEEMNKLYNHPKVKSFVSFTHGEGYGRPLQEATMVGLPVIASGWSGHVDFLDSNYSIFLPGKLENVPESAVWKDIILPESKWFYIDTNFGYKAFNVMFNEYEKFKEGSEKLMDINRNKFTLNEMTNELNYIMEKHLKGQPEQVTLKLPKLKKVKETV